MAVPVCKMPHGPQAFYTSQVRTSYRAEERHSGRDAQKASVTSLAPSVLTQPFRKFAAFPRQRGYHCAQRDSFLHAPAVAVVRVRLPGFRAATGAVHPADVPAPDGGIATGLSGTL